MALFIYTTLYTLFFPVFFMWFLWQVIRHKKFRRGLMERFGLCHLLEPNSDHPVIWIHAASVGEILAAEPILAELRQKIPALRYALTTNTDTGYEIAKKKMPFIEWVCQAPFDFPFVIQKVIKNVKPDLLMVMETEIWPNMIDCIKRSGIPILIANGRISDRAFPRYRKLSWFFQPILSKVSVFAMQSDLDAIKMIDIGARPDSVIIAGNVKYDREIAGPSDSSLPRLIDKMGWCNSNRVFIAGSTHGDEEDIVCQAFSEVRKHYSDFKMILAPRHLHRINEVIETLKKHQMSYTLRSQMPSDQDFSHEVLCADVLILDVMGELVAAYSLGGVAFVGGSLQNIGGHNVLEPAAVGRPVLFGPFTSNFKEAVSLLTKYDGGLCVKDSRELVAAIIRLTKDPKYASDMGERGRSIVNSNKGAVNRHVSAIIGLISHGGEPAHNLEIQPSDHGVRDA